MMIKGFALAFCRGPLAGHRMTSSSPFDFGWLQWSIRTRCSAFAPAAPWFGKWFWPCCPAVAFAFICRSGSARSKRADAEYTIRS